MGGGTTTQQSSGSTASVNQIPAWMSNAGQQNYALAQDIANRPLQQYQGAMVADTSPQTQQAWNLAASGGNVGQPAYDASQAGYLGAIGATPGTVTAGSITPQSVTSGQLSNTNLQPYMNPYTRNVIDTTLPIMQQQLGLQQNQQANQASSAGAFGGSRQGVQAGVTQAQGALNMANMAAQLNQANFTQAQAGATGDIANRLKASQGNQATNLAAQTSNQANSLAAQQSNQAAIQAKINSDINASGGLSNIGQAQQKGLGSLFAMLTTAGAGQQQQAQDQINAQMAKFNQAYAYPQQGLGLMLSALGMTPHDTSQYGASDQTSSTTTPTNYGNLATSGLGALSNIWSMSDPKMKTAVTPLGKDPITGVPIKAFRFKGEPSTMPKVVGPMAADVAKAIPGSVATIDGIKRVRTPALAAATPSVAHLPIFSANTMRGPLGRAPRVSRPRVLGALGGR